MPGGEISRCQESPDAGSCYDHQHQHLDCKDLSCNSGEFSPKQQGNKKIGGIIKMSPEDEIEGEIIFYQHRLLANAVSRKRFTGILILLSSFILYVGFSTHCCLFALPHENLKASRHL